MTLLTTFPLYLLLSTLYIYIYIYITLFVCSLEFSLLFFHKKFTCGGFSYMNQGSKDRRSCYCRNCKAQWDDFVILGYIKLTVNNCKNDNWVRMQITIQWEHYEINLCMVAIKYAVNHIEQVFSVSCKDAPLTGFLMSFPRNRFAGLTPPTERELPLAPQIWQLTSKGRGKKRGWHKAYSIIMSITWL